MPQFSRPKRRATNPVSKVSTPSSQVAVLFGLPLAGTSSAIRCLMDATESPVALVHGLDEGEIRSHLRDGAKVVFVDDFEPIAENVQFLNDARLVYPGSGKLIQIWSAPEDVMARARVRNREDIDEDYLNEYREAIEAMEERVRLLNIDYRTIPNGLDFASAVASLAEIVGLVE